MCAKLINELGPALAPIPPHQTIQIPFVIPHHGCNAVALGLTRLRKVRNRSRKSLLVQVDYVQGILNGRLLLRLQVAKLELGPNNSMRVVSSEKSY